MEVNDRVRLVSVNGKTKPPKTVDSKENYWLLIGQFGTVQQDPEEENLFASFSEKPRVLVQFDEDVIAKYVNEYGMHVHNNVKNSLWILVSDLEIVK